MSGASGKGKEKGTDLVFWLGCYGPDWYPDPQEYFPLQGKKDFHPPSRLRPYDNRKEEWPKCCHGDNCVVQVYSDGGLHEGRRFLRCPRGWNSEDEEITRWVDPPAIYSYEEFIHYLPNRIFVLEIEVESMSVTKEQNTQEEEG